VVPNVFSVGPLARLAAFTGLVRVFSLLRDVPPVLVTIAQLDKKFPAFSGM
jgi:hypothetical protein